MTDFLFQIEILLQHVKIVQNSRFFHFFKMSQITGFSRFFFCLNYQILGFSQFFKVSGKVAILIQSITRNNDVNKFKCQNIFFHLMQLLL